MAIEKWRGEIDLHQGDRGEMRFMRRDGRIEGRMKVHRGEHVFEHDIDGSWVGDQIRFTRHLSATSVQPFEGKVTARGDEMVMEGRFAHAMAGAWSAVCRRTGPRTPWIPIGPRPPVIPIMRVPDRTPPEVTLTNADDTIYTVGDPVRLTARATDDRAVVRVEIFMDGAKLVGIDGARCDYAGTASAIGPHRLWAEAVDGAGNRGRSGVLPIMVHPTARPGPSLTIRTDPFHPTADDRVRFLAEASHPAGVVDVTHHVTGLPAHTCAGSTCTFEAGPFPAGTIHWRVSARSADGGETYGHDQEVEIAPRPTGNSVITGRLTGDRWNLFFVIARGPDDRSKHAGTATPDAGGNYRLAGLQPGRYWLSCDTRGDLPIGPHPSVREVVCGGGEVGGADFEIR